MHIADFQKVANMLVKVAESDSPRARRAFGLGALGGALGGTGGYLHTGANVATNPSAYPSILRKLTLDPRFWQTMFAEMEGVKGPSLHRSLLPAIAKAAPKKLLAPAAALGGVGALLGAALPVHKPSPGERLQKLWARRPDLLK